MKVLIRIDLSRYSVEQLKQLFTLQILNRDEYETELRSRGLSDWTVLQIMRAG